MKLIPKDRTALVEAALGKRPYDLLIKNVNMLNCFTGEIYLAEIGIYDGFIAHINSDPDNVYGTLPKMEGNKEYDGKGMYIIPGLVDTHIHIESTMMTPKNFAKAVIPHGTTTVITDPHEVANVLGLEAVKYMLEVSEGLPMRQYILAPSCVPAVPGIENAGAIFEAKEIKEMLSYDRVLGLAEVMDYPGVIYNSPRMVNILQEAQRQGKFIQGHAPQLKGRELSAYLCGGPTTDHETRIGQEAREKLRLGMGVNTRESSVSKDVEEILTSIKDMRFLPNLTFCTDDREPGDIIEEGHMNYVVKQAIKIGMDPVEAIRCATFNAAREIGIENLGAIAPGYAADLVIVPSLTELKPYAVFFEGELVAEEGNMIVNVPDREFEIENTNTMYITTPSEELFKIKAPIKEGTIHTRVITYESQASPITSFAIEELPIKDGYLDISKDENLKYCAVLNRHKGHDTYALGVVRGFGSKFGTVAGTVSHDCHNLTIVYSTAEEARIAAEELIGTGGGITCVKHGKVLGTLPLPICGLMSPLPCRELAEKISVMKNSLRGLGITSPNPLLRIATLALPVIPEAKISDLGLVSVLEQKIVPLFEG